MNAGQAKGILLPLLAASVLPGCCLLSPKPCPSPDTIVPITQLVGEFNANAARVPRLWARAHIEVVLPGKLGIPLTWGSADPDDEANGLLLLFKAEDRLGPQDFVLIGREMGEPVFTVGCSTEDRVYYVWYGVGDGSALFWGRNEYAGAPGIEDLPIDPLQLLSVLGVCELPRDFTRPPTVVMSMNNTPGQCAYVLNYLSAQPVTNHLVLRREIHFRWDEDEWRFPFLVNLFDTRGVRVMTATLKDFKPIRLAGSDSGDAGPVMPTDIRIEWPDKGTSLHIVLSDMVVDENKGEVEACKLWGDDGNLPDYITRGVQVDRGVEQGARRN